MIPEELKAPIMTFIERACEIPNLKRVVLFGSTLEGDMSKKSDIDLALFCDTKHNPELGKEAKIAKDIAYEIEDRYNVNYPFSFVFISTQNLGYTDSHFLHQLENEGLTIWQKEPIISTKDKHPDLEAYFLISYSTKELTQNQKVNLMRGLYGYNKKQKKGLADKYEAKISQGTLLVPGNALEDFKKLFNKVKAKYRLIKIWL